MKFIQNLLLLLTLTLCSQMALAADSDSDGIDDSIDNCVSIANADQLDTDGDGLGNACDADADADGVLNSFDSFPLLSGTQPVDISATTLEVGLHSAFVLEDHLGRIIVVGNSWGGG